MMASCQKLHQRSLRLCRDHLPVTGLKIIWVLAVLWYELGIFYHRVGRCSWPDATLVVRVIAAMICHLSTEKNGRMQTVQGVVHILVVADPQILDHRSYPTRPPILTFLTRLVVDLNLRKNWRAALWTHPHAVVFLGDMMDGGRMDMPDREYEQYYKRFKSIFRMNLSIPAYYIPGNHDVGLGVSSVFSAHANDRYISHFGPLNHRVSIANHTLIFLDAPGLVEEDYRRRGRKVDFDKWEPLQNGTIEFMHAVAQGGQINPAVVFTHIPLSRPDGSSCGPMRERGTIRAGLGFGYHNTLGPSVSNFLLQQLKPSIIFSGDDHDYCDYTHNYLLSGMPAKAREVTVKSLSMAMGIKQPGFQLLSLDPTLHRPTFSVPANTLCLLPDQLKIYVSAYIPLLAFSLLILFVSNIHRTRTHHRQLSKSSFSRMEDVGIESTTVASRSVMRIDPDVESNEQWTQLSGAGEENARGPSAHFLPPPATVLRRTRKKEHQSTALPSWSVVLFGRRRLIRIPQHCCAFPRSFFSLYPGRQRRSRWSRSRPRGLLSGFAWDVVDVALFPLGVFTSIACWLFLNG